VETQTLSTLEQESSSDLVPVKIRIGDNDDALRTFPSIQTQRAVRRFDETGEPTDFFTIGHHIIEFIETHCVLTDAEYAGRSFTLMSWQKRLLLEMYEVVLVEGRWKLRYRWALVGIPKKNGKTELAAALSIAHCVALDETSPNVICAASSDDQANLVFGAAGRIAEWSETLRHFLDVKEREIIVNTGAIPGVLKRVAAAAGTNDGKNVSACIIDELHEWIAPKSRAVFTVLTQGGGARRQPINIMITTAGSDEDTVCFELYEHGIQCRDGEIEDPTFYFVWYEAPEDCDHTDPEMWKIANPSWGLILKQDFYEDIITKRRESEFRRYFLNQWTDADEIWEAAQYWDGCAGTPVFDENLPTYVGIDIGRKHDSSAVVWCQWADGKLNVGCNTWTNPYPYVDPRHKRWTLDLVEVENFLRKLFHDFPESTLHDEEEYPLPGPCFLYDPHFFVRSAELLGDDGLNMVEFPQTDTRMVPASQNLFEFIKTHQLVHDGNPTLRRHVRGVTVKEKERGWRIGKPMGSRKHVDAAIAMAMSTYYCTAFFDHRIEGEVDLW